MRLKLFKKVLKMVFIIIVNVWNISEEAQTMLSVVGGVLETPGSDYVLLRVNEGSHPSSRTLL